MKLKLDENLGRDISALFVNAGHDVETVFSEGLSGADDKAVFHVCCHEQRCLVTLDLDFADPVRFSSRKCGGIAVLRIRGIGSFSALRALAVEFIQMLDSSSIDSGLWIIEPGRIRVHQWADSND